MKTIEATVDVTPDGTITLQLPPEILPGKHRVVIVIDERLDASIDRSTIDQKLAEMANDPEYQAEAIQLEQEFSLAQWEAFQQAEINE